MATIKEYKMKLDEMRYPYIQEAAKYAVAGEMPKLRNPMSIAAFMAEEVGLKYDAEEHLWALAFNTKNRLIGMFEVSHGTVNASLSSTRDIYMKLLMLGAVYWVAVHNHPSGSTEASEADVRVAKQMKDAGELLNISLMDNIIIGDGYLSFRENKIVF